MGKATKRDLETRPLLAGGLWSGSEQGQCLLDPKARFCLVLGGSWEPSHDQSQCLRVDLHGNVDINIAGHALFLDAGGRSAKQVVLMRRAWHPSPERDLGGQTDQSTREQQKERRGT